MSPAAEILVIILSVTLFVFLLVAIILGVYLVKLTAEIRRITKSAQETVETIGTAVSGVARLTSPMFVAEMVGRYIKKFTKNKKEK
jgi:uncharacterized protein YoxC